MEGHRPQNGSSYDSYRPSGQSKPLPLPGTHGLPPKPNVDASVPFGRGAGRGGAGRDRGRGRGRDNINKGDRDPPPYNDGPPLSGEGGVGPLPYD